MLILRPKKESIILENFLDLIGLYEKKMVYIIDDQKKLDDFNYFIVFLYYTSHFSKGRDLFSRLISKKIGNAYMSGFVFHKDATISNLCKYPNHSYRMNKNTYIELNIISNLDISLGNKATLTFNISSKIKEFDSSGSDGSINLRIDNTKYDLNMSNILELLFCS